MKVVEAATEADQDDLDDHEVHGELTHMIVLICLQDSTGVPARGVGLKSITH